MDHATKVTDADYLSDVLRRAGVLNQGRVTRIETDRALAKRRSRSMRLLLTYTGAPASAPGTLFLKTGPAEVGIPDGSVEPKEVEFYRDVCPLMTPGLVPHCFEAAWSSETGEWFLLLEDLADTHAVATAWPLPPTVAQCETILRTRARLHARWWDDASLGLSVGRARNRATTLRMLRSFETVFASFASLHGELVPPGRLRLLARLIDQAPRLAARYESGRSLTLIQGDAHVWNCLLPRDNPASGVRLIDWEDWRVSTATDDLAYMMAVHWYPDRRSRLERPLLDHYHAHLLSEGVSGYRREALQDDYRLSVLWHLMTPVWQAAYKIPPVIWWNNLERIMLAVDDLGCRDLLRG